MSVTTSDWIKGISLSILASLIGGASKLSIRKSWITTSSAVVVSPKLLRGCGMIGMTILNPACCVLAMQYASPSILAPFSGLTLVWIILFSPFFLQEYPSENEKLAALCIVGGEIICTIFGDHTNHDYLSIDDLMRSYSKFSFWFYFYGLSMWMLIIYLSIQYSSNEKLIRFAWGVSGGSITGLQNFLKDALTIMKFSYFAWQLYFFFACAAASAFIGLLLLVACMKRYHATYSSSMFVGSFVISASIMSAIHYHTFDNLENIWNFFFYPFGICILLIGIYILSQEEQEKEEDTLDYTIQNDEGIMVDRNDLAEFDEYVLVDEIGQCVGKDTTLH